MKITAQEEYGLRCLLQLARHRGPEPLTIPAIAETEGLSVPYVAKILTGLRQAGLVESVRGRGGGFALSRPPDRITVIDALQGLGGDLFDTGFCDTHHGASDVCVHVGDCSIRSLWGVVGQLMDRVLGRTTLADLVRATGHCGSLRLPEDQLAGLVEKAGGVPAAPRRSDLVSLQPSRKTR